MSKVKVQIQCPLSACFLAQTAVLDVSSHGGRGKGGLLGLFYKSTNSIHVGLSS